IAVRDAPVAVVAALALALVAIVTRPVLIALLSGVSVMLVGAGTLVLLSVANDGAFFGALERQLAARRARERVGGPGVVFVQIDGLAHPALERASHDG